jgi:5'-nucleotidase
MIIQMLTKKTFLAVALLSALAVVPAASASAAKAPARLKVLVSNDDGIKGEGMSALVKALRKEAKVTVTVVAPATNQSGTGGKTTPGALTTKKTTTLGGFPAVAVNGFPADSVNYALDNLLTGKKKPDLVIAGINFGANVGPFVPISGTVGAARAGAARGIASLATSQGLAAPMGWAAGVKETIAWVRANRSKLKKGSVWNLNIPSCSSGKVRGTVKVGSTSSTFYAFDAFGTVDCSVKSRPLTNDVTAYFAGFAPLVNIGR